MPKVFSIALSVHGGSLKDIKIDIVGLKLEKNQAVVAEVKRQKKNFKPELLVAKTEHLKQKLLPKYRIEMRCLSLEDM